MYYLTAKLDDNGQINFIENVIIEKQISDGRVDISSISNWDSLTKSKKMFNIDVSKDIKFIRDRIREIRINTGFQNLTIIEQKICLKYFSAGGGQDYINPLYTKSDYDSMFDEYKKNMEISRKLRDVGVTRYLSQKIYNGLISKTNIDLAVNDSQTYRDMYLRDGIEGIGYGDTQKGIMNFVKDDLPTYPGFDVNISNEIFEIYNNGDNI